jgi:hypothetical protein
MSYIRITEFAWTYRVRRDVDQEHSQSKQATADTGSDPVNPLITTGESKDKQPDR